MKLTSIIREATGKPERKRMFSILREAPGDEQDTGQDTGDNTQQDEPAEDAPAEEETDTQEENTEEEPQEEENPDEENPDENTDEPQSFSEAEAEAEGDNPEGSTDEGTEGEEESPDELKNKGVLKDAIYLYDSIRSSISKLEDFRHINIIANRVAVQVKANLTVLQDMLFQYITVKHQQYDYAKNLYVYNYFIEAYKLNVRMLDSIGKFTDTAQQ